MGERELAMADNRVATAVANELESWADALEASDFEATHELTEAESRQAMLLLHFLVGRAVSEARNLRVER